MRNIYRIMVFLLPLVLASVALSAENSVGYSNCPATSALNAKGDVFITPGTPALPGSGSSAQDAEPGLETVLPPPGP